MPSLYDFIPRPRSIDELNNDAPIGPLLSDIGKSAGIGAARSGIGFAGLPGDLSEYGARGLDRATRAVGGLFGLNIAPRADQEPTYGSADIQKAIEGRTGQFYQPQTPAGQKAERIAKSAADQLGTALILSPLGWTAPAIARQLRLRGYGR